MVGWLGGWLAGGGGVPMLFKICFFLFASYFFFCFSENSFFFFFSCEGRRRVSSFFFARGLCLSIAFWLFAFLFVCFCIARRSISSFLRCLSLLFISNRVLCIFIFFLILLRFSLWNVAVVVGWLMGQLATASLFSFFSPSFCLQERSLFSLDYSVSRSRTVVFWFFVSLCARVLSLLFNRLASSFSL